MSTRRLPLQPNLDQLKHQAKDLLRLFRAGDVEAAAEFAEHHPEKIDPVAAQLADAQLVLARMYQAPSWSRLVQAVELITAIWNDDVEAVRQLVVKHPNLIHEHALIRDNNWGPPMSFAANLGRDRIIRLMHQLGADDYEHAIGRATLQSRIYTGRMLYEMSGSPPVKDGDLGGPAYTLSVPGTAFLFEIGAKVHDKNGKPIGLEVVLGTDSRKPPAKHAILEMYAQHGLVLPDTPTMALHRGRIDLLEDHLRRDPHMLTRTFSQAEIFPPEHGCSSYIDTLGTPLDGTTLLHIAVEYEEMEIAKWLLAKGMNVDVKAAIDADGFGGFTPLFVAVVCYANFWGNYQKQTHPEQAFAKLLLEHGADPTVRASVRRHYELGDLKGDIEARDVTPYEWGEVFPGKILVSRSAMELTRRH